MRGQNSNPQKFELSDYTLWGAIALGIVLLLASQSQDRATHHSSLLPEGSTTGQHSELEERLALEAKVRDRINRRVTEHLQSIDQMKQSEQWRVEQVNRDTAPSLDQLDLSFLNQDFQYPAHLANLPPDRRSEAVYRDITSGSAPSADHWPEQRINAQLEHKRWMQDYETRYEAEFVNAFLANAREQGYEIELNDSLEVVDIKRIRRPQPLRFPQSESSQPQRESYGGAVR